MNSVAVSGVVIARLLGFSLASLVIVCLLLVFIVSAPVIQGIEVLPLVSVVGSGVSTSWLPWYSSCVFSTSIPWIPPLLSFIVWSLESVVLVLLAAHWHPLLKLCMQL